MRVWIRKIYCPSFICFFCKPPQNLCTPSTQTPTPATLTPTDFQSAAAAASTVSVVADSDHLSSVKKEDEGEDLVDDDDDAEGKTVSELGLRSSIKRKDVEVEEVRKKTVKWMDVAGKELVQVQEFEISESEDTDSDNECNRGCNCPIL